MTTYRTLAIGTAEIRVFTTKDLAAEEQAAWDAILPVAAQQWADDQLERDMVAMTDGPGAVAEAARLCGLLRGDVDVIEQHYREMQDKARKRATAA